MGEKFADIEEKYDLKEVNDGFGEENDDDAAEDNEEQVEDNNEEFLD